MALVRVEMSTTLEKLLDKLTALEQYEETLVDVSQVGSVDQLSQVKLLSPILKEASTLARESISLVRF